MDTPSLTVYSKLPVLEVPSGAKITRLLSRVTVPLVGLLTAIKFKTLLTGWLSLLKRSSMKMILALLELAVILSSTATNISTRLVYSNNSCPTSVLRQSLSGLTQLSIKGVVVDAPKS